MHKVNINMNNLKVTNYDTDTRPFEFCICINNIDNVYKEIELENRIQKTDIFGNKLFYTKINDKYVEITEDQSSGYDFYPIFNISKTLKDVKLTDYPNEFNLNDIIEFKKKEILADNVDFKYCDLYEINLHNLVDFNYIENKSDIGFKIIRIDSFGKTKLHLDITHDKVKELKLLSDKDISIKYSVNGEDYLDYNDFIKSSKNINTVDMILINDSEEEVVYDNICILMR